MDKTSGLETVDLVRQWMDERLVEVRTPDSGTINDVRILKTDRGRYVLRIYRHREQKRIEREHAVVRWVHEHGIPAVEPLPLPSGRTFLAVGGRLVSLLPFVEGRQVTRSEMRPVEIYQMGMFLGRLHEILARCPLEDIPSIRVDLDRDKTIGEIDRLLAQIQSIEKKRETDHYSLTRLKSRRAWLARRSSDGRIVTDTQEAHPLHGDYQETNVFFRGNRICGVIDWDKVYRAPPAWEIIRTLDLMLRFNSAGSQVFLDGYMKWRRVILEELDEAVKMYGLMRAYDLWLPKAIYDEGNDRVRPFVRPGSFTPIEDQWEKVRGSLSLN